MNNTIENGYHPLSTRHRSPFQYKGKRFINIYQFILYCQFTAVGEKENANKVLIFKNNSDLYSFDAFNKKGQKGRAFDGYYKGKAHEKFESYCSVGMLEAFKQNQDFRSAIFSIKDIDKIQYREGVFGAHVCKHFEQSLKNVYLTYVPNVNLTNVNLIKNVKSSNSNNQKRKLNS